jgi:general secretion pathway protein L
LADTGNTARGRAAARCYNAATVPDSHIALRYMSERLLIRLHADGQLSWLAQDAGGRALSGTNAGAPPAATLARSQRIVVLVPSEQVVLLEADAVSTRRAQLAKAVPFALEDQLVSPVEELHFALPDTIAGARVAVAVVARATLREWIDTLAQAGIRADVIIPEAIALAANDGSATLMIEPERALLRWSPAHAVACDPPALAQWLSLVAAPAAEVFDFRQAPRQVLPIAVSGYHERQLDPLLFLAAQLVREPGLNLLQGEFAANHRHLPLPQLWRRAALLAAAAVLLAVIHGAGDWLRLNRESGRLEEEQRAALRASLPELANVAGDPRQLMESALARMRGGESGSGLLALLDRIGPILAGTTRVSLKSVEYRNATLEIGLRAPDVPALDLVREQLANIGLNAEVTSASTASDKGVDGRLRISRTRP